MKNSIIEEIHFLKKPEIKYEYLNYIKSKREIYVNLFEFNTEKDSKIYKYPFSIKPEIDKSAFKLLQSILKNVYKELHSIYGIFTISGDSLYSMIKIEEIKIFKSTVHLKGKSDYIIEIQRFTNERIIKKEDVRKDNLTKQFIEIIIKDILLSNPNLDFDKDLFVLKEDKKKIESEKMSINCYPGFITKFIETEKGNYINVSLRNKFESSENILEYLDSRKYKNKYNQSKIQKDLRGKWFYFSRKKYKIDEILFDRNPLNQTTFIDGKNMTIKEFYSQKFKVEIKNMDQPLILCKKQGPQNKIFNSYYIPELCNFSGLDDKQQKNYYFMKELNKITKIDPETRIRQTNKFLELLKNENKKGDKYLSSKEKYEQYGIIVQPPKETFYGYLMQEPTILAGNNKIKKAKDQLFKLYKKSDMNSWLCIYEKSNYNNADYLYKNLSKASKAFGLSIAEPKWIEMDDNNKSGEWVDEVEKYFSDDEENNKYSFVVFLIGNNRILYEELKRHSLCKNGYVSQVVKATSLKNKGFLSTCSKILLQINAKLGGISYMIKEDKAIHERDVMVVGVDSSHFNKKTGVAMVSTIDDSFANFYNKERVFTEEKKEIYQYCVSSFLEEAIPEYVKKSNKMPKNIIIYRQGISDNLINVLKDEIFQIEEVCKKHKILFYYILVNTKTTFKFFEKSGDRYFNPGAGLLVIDGVTSPDKFEFFIQPQQVTGGSATPTRFHVAYGNMNFPEIIPKFTYDLCHIYSNWQGTVRIPNVIKAAEKLSKMTVKTTQEELNENLKLGQSYL